MTDEIALRHQVAQVALKHMFRPDRYFSVCDLDAIATTLGVVVPRSTREILAPLHCVHWGAMPPHLRARVVGLVLEALGLSLDEMVAAETPQEKRNPSLLRRIVGNARGNG